MALTYDLKLKNWLKMKTHMSNAEGSISSDEITRIPKKFW